MTTVISGSYPAINSDSDATVNGLTVGKGGGASFYNTVVGAGALASNTTGIINTAVGSTNGANATLSSNTTGNANNAFGAAALGKNTTASNNNAFGYEALRENTTGASNCAFGHGALTSNTTGGNNTAVGYQTGYNNTTGVNGTFIGFQAGYNNTTASGNLGIGIRALGWNGAGVTGGSNNAVGDNALYSITSGAFNTALGTQCLFSNTTASNNTAVGYQAGYSNTTGTNMAAFGYQAAYSNTTGEITAFGRRAGYTNTTSSASTYIGDAAGFNTTGASNTFVGGDAGSAVTSGAKNTIIGRYNGNQGGLDIRTLSNRIVLSDGDGNPRLWIDNNGDLNVPKTYTTTTGNAANLHIGTDGFFYRSTSSLKYKRDVENATHGLSEVLQLRPVTYKGKSESDGDKVFGGLIAEEVHDAGLTEFVQYAPDGSPDALAYGNMVSLCIKAIQELKAEVDSLKAQLNK